MGWTSSYRYDTPTTVREDLLRMQAASPNHEVVAHRTTNFGRHFWMVTKVTFNGESKTIIVLAKIAKFGPDEWGYKDISEEMGPVEYDCPVGLLDLCDDAPNEWAAKWREQVRAFAALRSRTYEAGDRCLVHGREYEVIGRMPSRTGRTRKAYRIRRVSDGRVFKSTPAKMRPLKED